MSAISKTYKHTNGILEVVDILPNVSFTTSETELITNKNSKYELTDQLPNDASLKKIPKLNGIIV